MKRLIFLILLFALGTAPALGQRADLSGIKICINPGHGGYNSNDRHIIPDPGTDFWESESNFQKALLLKSLLEAKGAWVILTRTTNDSIGYPNTDDSDEPSLTARVATANANNVDWFHSIHSNAFNASSNYTLVLVRENRSALGTPQSPEALAMAQIMSPAIKEKLRTTGNLARFDYSFLGYSLGVLSGLIMPGELSEGSFHDVFPETRRLMNNDYRKMEAYALRNAIMEYYGVPADPRAIIARIEGGTATCRTSCHVPRPSAVIFAPCLSMVSMAILPRGCRRSGRAALAAGRTSRRRCFLMIARRNLPDIGPESARNHRRDSSRRPWDAPRMNDLPGEARTLPPISELARRLAAGRFAVTAELTPPVSTDPSDFLARASALKGLATAVNVTDGAGAKAHLSALVAAHMLLQAGIEPVLARPAPRLRTPRSRARGACASRQAR